MVHGHDQLLLWGAHDQLRLRLITLGGTAEQTADG
jgi:hypothetical protein